MIIRELFVKIGLIDNSSDRLKDVQKEADRASQNFQKLGVNGQTSLDMMGRAVGLTSNEMEKLISKTKTDLKLEKDFKDAARAAGLTEEEISRVKNSIDRAKESAASWKGVMAGLASLGIGAMAGSVISNGVKMAAQAEDTAIQFEVLQGSAEKAKNTIEALQKFSANTPFESDQVLKAGRQLLAVKFSSEELIPTLKMIGDVSKGTGKDFNELATIFAKNKSSNFIQGEDLNQLIEAGIPILDQFGKMFGKTALQVKEMGSKNQIEFKHLKQAFQNMTKDGGDYSRMMERLSKTSIGMFSTAVDGFKTWSKMIGNFVLDIAKPFLQFFTDAERGNMRLYTALTILAVLLGSVLVSATMAWATSLDAVTMASIRTYAALIGPAVILAAKILAVYLILEDIWTFFEYGPRQSETYFADLLKWMGLTKYDLLVLWDTMDDLKVMFLEAWENITEAFQNPKIRIALIAIGVGLALLLAPMAVLSLALFALKTVLVVGIVLGIAYIAAKWNELSEKFDKKLTEMKNGWNSLWESIKKGWNIMINFLIDSAVLAGKILISVLFPIAGIFIFREEIKNALSYLWNLITEIPFVQRIVEQFAGMKERLMNVLSGMWDSLKAVFTNLLPTDSINAVIDLINTMIGKLNDFTSNSIAQRLGITPLNLQMIPHIQAREFGGPIEPGVVTRVGERGPETIVTGQAGTVIPNISSGGSTVSMQATFHIHSAGESYDAEVLWEKILGLANGHNAKNQARAELGLAVL